MVAACCAAASDATDDTEKSDRSVVTDSWDGERSILHETARTGVWGVSWAASAAPSAAGVAISGDVRSRRGWSPGHLRGAAFFRERGFVFLRGGFAGGGFAGVYTKTQTPGTIDSGQAPFRGWWFSVSRGKRELRRVMGCDWAGFLAGIKRVTDQFGK